VALLDDDPAKRGRVVHGVRVAGGIDDYASVARKLGVGTAIIAMPTVPSALRRQIVQRCIASGAQVLTVPSFEELMTGQVSVDWLRRIELEDLLTAEPENVKQRRERLQEVLLKVGALLIFIIVFADTTLFDTKVFAATIIACTLAWTAAEMWVFTTTKVLYVDPEAGS
jgi:hypothetical protein